MKNILIVVLLLLSLNLFSQENGFELGVKAGGGISFLYSTDNSINIVQKISPVFSSGISFAFSKGEMFQLHTDLMYERKSITQNFSFGNFSNPQTKIFNSVDYVSLSVLPGLKTKGKVKFLFFGGPSMDLVVNAQSAEIFKTGINKEKRIIYYNNNVEFKDRFALGLVLGTGIQTSISEKVNFRLTLRNNLTLFKPNFNLTNFNTTNLMVGVFYSLNKKKKD